MTSKKLSIDDWLTTVKDRRRGDILCPYLLNMITGRHTCVHLKNSQLWSTLKSVPVNHDDHVNSCDFHLVYLGFGAFIRLVPRQAPDVKDFVIIGHITTCDPATSQELNTMATNWQQLVSPPKTCTPSAAAGSAAQLPRVEAKMGDISNIAQVVKRPFQVKLK